MNDPQVQLPVERVMCQVHGEPFRAQWPVGYASWALKLAGKALESSDLHAMTRGQVANIDGMLEVLPACLWVSEDTLLEGYREAGIGRLRRCAVCGENALGTPFETLALDYDHLCFFCVIENGKTHHAGLQRNERRRQARRAKRRRPS